MSDNEQLLLEKFSDLLTGGNAGTWDQIEHAIATLTAEAASLRAENERLRAQHRKEISEIVSQAQDVTEAAEARIRALEAEARQIVYMRWEEEYGHGWPWPIPC